MADPLRTGPIERDIEQAITALKKGAHLLKYGRRGKPKFCPFRLSNDESVLIWYSGKDEKQLRLNQVSKIIPGQRTICKDKDEAEVWFVGLKALISRANCRNWRIESKSDRSSSDSSSTVTRKNSPPTAPFGGADSLNKDSEGIHAQYETHPISTFGRVFSDVILYTTTSKGSLNSDAVSNSINSLSSGGADISNVHGSAVDNIRVSLSSAVSSSSHGSGHEDFDALGDVFIWGEGVGDGLLGGGLHRVGSPTSKIDVPLPKALESTVVLDVHNIACGTQHAVLVTKQGEVFSWGEESGGRLGHGMDSDVSQPKLIDALSGMNIEFVACGEYHTCAVTLSGDLYTWGDGVHSGFLGHGNETSYWIPKKVCGQLEGLHVSSVSCGPWHTAVVTSAGQLFTFGDGTFGALGHGDRRSMNIPREVEALKGLRTVRAACGVWHSAAIVEINDKSDSGAPSGKLFTWGDGDKGRLGHGDREPRLVPACVAALSEPSFCQVACGHDVTMVLSTSGHVYMMGSNVFGQLGNPEVDGKRPTCVQGNISNSFVEEIACGAYHSAVLTSKTEVYTWGKGANGRLGHGDNDDRNTPTLVEALKDKQVRSVVCGSNFTAVICLHKWVSGADQSVCSGCRLPFGFRRKRHNCYNCGLVFCKACSSRKSVKASLAPNVHKPYRVCDECYTKLKKIIGDGIAPRIPKLQNGSTNQLPSEQAEKDVLDPRVQGQFSRLSSVDSFKGENRQLRQNNSRITPILNQWRNFNSTNSSNIQYASSKKIFSASVPTSRAGSRSTSPVPFRPSPPLPTNAPTTSGLTSPETYMDDSKQADQDLSQEVARLRLQVEDLTRKSELLEAELSKTSKQLKEATAIAGEEAAKCKAAKEVIKSLTAQLKGMADKVPDRLMIGNNVSIHASDPFGHHSCENNISSVPELPDSNGESGNHLPCNGNRISTEGERVEQIEPGVYITVASSPGGDKYLKRVRFSRRMFSEHQAENWWAQNKLRLQEKYTILTAESPKTDPATV
ncbi:uncharacterized protein LOC109704181 isoform X2 [Ananas comosus]|uniref:Uncharacterized protein LOC109704181 isoform X2 n=1 Tax=Ananas comosus TaxID=4615 RepID=A0A6P5EBB2_ANACO|nr:uncharacterized protein LOC109704181 isoform X2 [Ananas comosus]